MAVREKSKTGFQNATRADTGGISSEEALWSDENVRRLTASVKAIAREAEEREKEELATLADERTRQAQAKLRDVEGILRTGLATAGPLRWEELSVRRQFAQSEPVEPTFESVYDEPQRDDDIFKPALNLIDYIVPPLRRKKKAKEDAHYERLHAEWRGFYKAAKEENDRRYADFLKAKHGWEQAKDEFEALEEARLKRLTMMRSHYQANREDAIPEYFSIVLEQSDYPFDFPSFWDLEYIAESKLLVVDYGLPNLEMLPAIKEVKYLVTKNKLKELPLTKRSLETLYGEVIYQMTLRSVYELFAADERSYLDSVIFNGYVEMVDPAIGQRSRPCILSLRVSRETLSSISLANVTPEVCFRRLKGISGRRISKMAPVTPIAKPSRDSSGFVAYGSHAVS